MATRDPESGWRGRLAEMEEQLHALASELAEDLGEPVPDPPSAESDPAREPAPALSDPAREPPPALSDPVREPPLSPATPIPQLLRSDPSPPPPPADANAHLEAMCARLLAAMREMLAGYELALRQVVTHPPGGPAVTVAAGPFASVSRLERFEDALRALPEVGDVAVRGYEGSDRALLEVQLRE